MPRSRLPILASSLALAAAGCTLASMERATGVKPDVQGDLTWRAPDGSVATFAGVGCVSGDRASFRGVDLRGPRWVLRIVADPLDGMAAAVLGTDDGARFVFRSAACATLAGDVQRTGWRVDDVWDVSGHLTADCRLASGARLEGSVSFAHCH